MRIVDTTLGLAASALISFGFYATPVGLASYTPKVDTYDIVAEAPRQAVFVTVSLPPEPEPEPEVVPPAPEPEPAYEDAVQDRNDEGRAEAPPEPEGMAAIEAPDGTDAAGDLSRRAPSHWHGVLKKPGITNAQKEAKLAAARKKKRRSRECLDIEIPEIEDLGDNKYTVERDFVDTYSKDLDEAAKLAWVGWHKDDQGKIDGFVVRKIRCGSVLHTAGFRNGDVVHAINGKEVTNIPQALLAYRKLRKKRVLKVDVTRVGGENLVLRYRLT